MRRFKIQEIPNLKDITFTQAKRLSRDLCPHMTDEKLSELTGIKRSTIQRIFTDPKYHPAMPNIPSLCESLGNHIMIQWPAAQIGGYVVFPPQCKTKTSLQCYIADITREFSDLLEIDARAKLNKSPGGRDYTAAECAEIIREMDHLGEKLEAAKLMLSKGLKRK